MKESLVDVPVLLLFFVRPDKTKEVFAKIKEARPSKLYLYQDGPRQNRADDIENIKLCREIVEDIDWDCEVHKHYCDENVGCDPSGYLSRKWMFETEEYGIILEDDTVASVSFFRYCKELLERYKDNDRIQMISGYNPVDYFDAKNGADYFFSTVASIWGWATWKRVTDTWDGKYEWLENPALLKKVEDGFISKQDMKTFIASSRRHRDSKKEYFETINTANMYIYDRIVINPTHNMISNIGFGNNTTHGTNEWDLVTSRTKKLLYKEMYEYEFPLKHPDKIEVNTKYKHAVDVALGHTWFTNFAMNAEYAFLLLKNKGIKGLASKIKKKMRG